MKTITFWVILVASSAYLIPAVANTSIINNVQSINECGVNKIEIIVGGKADIGKTETQQNSKCFIYTLYDSAKTKLTHSTKPEKLAIVTTVPKNNNTNINLNDPNSVKDRNFILQSELKKSTLLRDELSAKKKIGLIVDELQLSRLDADITAIKNEISR